MGWFDLQGIIDLLTLVYESILNLYNVIDGIETALVDYVISLAWAFIGTIGYPMYAGYTYLNYYEDRIVQDVLAPFVSLNELEDMLVSLIMDILGLFVDASTMSIMLACIGLVVVLRIYNFLKEISIAGFKI